MCWPGGARDKIRPHEHLAILIFLTFNIKKELEGGPTSSVGWDDDRFCSGQLHPLAEQPIIDITTKSPHLGCCDVLIEIVGDLSFKSDLDNRGMS